MSPKRKRDDKKGMSTSPTHSSGSNSQQASQEPRTPAPINRPLPHVELTFAEATFDRVYDGLNCKYHQTHSLGTKSLRNTDDPSIDGQQDLDEYRRAWQLRRDLAELSRRPEGYYFTWRTWDGRIRGAPLLTPPDLEAVQRADGTWFRTRRQLDQNHRASYTPVPYTEQWYAEYLQHFGLPTYFLRDGHLVMLTDNIEARRLAVNDAPSQQYATIPRRDYLDLRFSAKPYWPSQDSDGPYIIDIQSEGARASLAHHYPALSVTQFPYHTYVLPSGHIQLHSVTEDDIGDLTIQAETDVEWEGFEDGQRAFSSYHRESTGHHPWSRPSEARDVLVQRAIDHHAVVNPMEDVPGQGQFTFLSDQDQQLAHRLGYMDAQGAPDPREVTRARMRGDLAVGTGPNAGPIIIFRPNESFRNPRVQPEGQGAWRFLTNDGHTSNRGFAAINFGGSHGLPAYPTASQIRRLGQLFIDDNRQNLTDMIDIVWVPGDHDDEPGNDPVLDAPAEEEEEEEDVVSPTPAKKRRASRASASASSITSPPAAHYAAGTSGARHPNHDPTNNNGVPGGPYDQTGDPNRAEYQTEWARGRYVTIDRSRVKVGLEDWHKLWCYSARGWKKWSKAKDMDFHDKKMVSDLNKHREQTHQRAGYWKRKRAEPREDYTHDEKEFIMELVVESRGERPDKPLKEIAKEFNERFVTRRKRNDTGIQSLIDRLRKEYQEYGGLKPRKGRGWKQQQASKQLRGVDSSGKKALEDEESDGESEGDEESDAEGEDDDGGEGEGDAEGDDYDDAEGEDEDAEGEEE